MWQPEHALSRAQHRCPDDPSRDDEQVVDDGPERGDQKVIADIERAHHQPAQEEADLSGKDDPHHTRNDVANARHHQQDPQDLGQEAGSDRQDAERKEPEAPECRQELTQVVAQPEKAERKSVQSTRNGLRLALKGTSFAFG